MSVMFPLPSSVLASRMIENTDKDDPFSKRREDRFIFLNEKLPFKNTRYQYSWTILEEQEFMDWSETLSN